MSFKFQIKNISSALNREQVAEIFTLTGDHKLEKVNSENRMDSYTIEVFDQQSIRKLALLNRCSIGGSSLSIIPIQIEGDLEAGLFDTSLDNTDNKKEYKDPILCTLLTPERARKLLHSSFHSTLWEKICFLKTFEELGVKIPDVVHKQIEIAISRTNRTVFITKIPPNIDKGKLKKILLNFGEVNDIRYNKNNKTGLIMAFVEYKTKDGAKKAIYLDGSNIEGNNIGVTFSRNPILKSDEIIEQAYLEYKQQVEAS